jgi:hypothetical protein
VSGLASRRYLRKALIPPAMKQPSAPSIMTSAVM